MSGTMREIVSALAAAEKPEQETSSKVLITLDIEDDKLFLLHFIIGTYFGPDLKSHHHPNKQSAFNLQAANLSETLTSDELSSSRMKRAEIENVYHHILSNADPSLTIKPRVRRQYFNGKRNASNEDDPLFTDLFPSKLHPESRVRNQYKLIKSIVFINDPDISCMRQDCVERFKRLTGIKSFALSLEIDVNEDSNSIVAINEVVEEEIDQQTCLGVVITWDDKSKKEESLVAAKPKPGFVVKCNGDGTIAGAQVGPVVGLMDIGECPDAYLFRVSLPGVRRDERDFSCEVEDNGKVLVRGVTTTGEKRVLRYSHVFEMQTQNLCPPGQFSVSFRLPGPVHPHEFSGSFGTDGILEGIVMKKLKKQCV